MIENWLETALAARPERPQLERHLFGGGRASEGEAALSLIKEQLRRLTEELAQVEAELEARLAALSPGSAAEPEPGPHAGPAPEAALAGDHLLFVPARGGYRLQAGEGALPPAGGSVELEGRRYVVVKLATSPLPRDERLCAYVQPA